VIDDMPRQRKPHLHHEKTRHDKWVWYVRVDGGPRIRMRETYGTPEFDAAYDTAVKGTPPPPKQGAVRKNSLAWLIAQYRDAGPWLALSKATRKQRENIFTQVKKTAAHEPATDITRDTILDGVKRREKTPSQARHFLDAMRGLFEWAVKAEHVDVDPTAGVVPPPRPKTQGFPAWTEEHVEQYQARWPLGTKERVWLDVLLYSGLRRGDVVRYGRQHVRRGVGRIKTEKGGYSLTVTLPVLPALQATIEAGPCGDLTFIVGAKGQPLTKESFGNAFREACRAAGVPGSAHGVRKIAATTAANNGASVAQLKALFGWEDDSMPSLYTKTADRERLGLEAAHMLGNAERTATPAPRRAVVRTRK
jgi:integrase